MQKLLTIVVPVYKVEQYINKCLDSCIIYKENGTLDEDKMNQLEVIIVNDGTPDRSAEMSREYTVRYPQTFRQIDKENGGHGSAWNVGLKEATGKYLRFLDSDDWLMNLDKLMGTLDGIDTDLIFSPMKRVYDNQEEVDFLVVDEIDKIESIKLFNFNANPVSYISNFWYVTYKREILIFDKPLFLERCFFDDDVLFVAPFVKSQNYMVCDYFVYYHLVGRSEQSTSNTVVKKNVEMLLENHKYMIDFWKEYGSLSSLGCSHQGIKDIIAMNASFVFNKLFYLPYMENKKGHSICVENMLDSSFNLMSHKVKRYLKYPFVVYWLMEKFRIHILKR